MSPVLVVAIVGDRLFTSYFRFGCALGVGVRACVPRPRSFQVVHTYRRGIPLLWICRHHPRVEKIADLAGVHAGHI